MTVPAYTAESFYAFLKEGRLMASRCGDALYVPPRPICPETHADADEWVELSGRGTLAAYTVIAIAPTAMIEAGYGRDNPYCSAIIALEEGPMIAAQLIGVDVSTPEAIQIGTPVQVVFGEHDHLVFEPQGA